MQAQVDSPTYRGGLWRKDRAALVDPARLVWGLKAAAEALGVRIYEDTKATELEHDGVGMLVTTPLGPRPRRQGRPRHERLPAAAATHAALHRPGLRLRMVTEPLTADQLASRRLGATGRASPTCANQFHYYRLTEDNRILWGGYDAIYYFGGKVNDRAGAAPGDVGQAGRALLHDLPAARRRPVQPRVGRGDRHLHAASACSGARRCRAGWRTRSATPASAWPPPASAPR